MTSRARCFFALLMGLLALRATAESLSTVTVVAPTPFIAITTGATPDIYIDGPISNETIAQLAAVVAVQSIKAATVYLNSPGGSLLAGIDLGKVIRRHGFDTNVGRKPIGNGSVIEGGCYSACVFAYLGGGYRYLNSKSEIGVHRFSTAAPAASDLDMAQIVSAAITNHLNAMGVDIALFERMTQAPKDGIIVLSNAERKGWRVVNDGVLPPVWGLVNTKGVIYLKGEQQTYRGLGKFIFGCQAGTIVGAAFYEGGTNAETIAATKRYSLRIDSQFVPVQLRGEVQLLNGFVSANFPISAEQLRAIITAQEVGFAFHPPNETMFFGYTVGLLEGRAKILEFVNFCATTKSSH